MADISFKLIKRNATNEDIVEYLDYMARRLEYAFENLDEENLTENLKKKIGGSNGN